MTSQDNKPTEKLEYSYEKYRHDPFFKSIFGKPAFTLKFLNWALPADITNSLELDKLQRCQESFLDDQLKSSFADIIFKVPIKPEFIKNNENQELPQDIFLFLLFEHKTFSDKWVVYQLFRYISKIWEQEFQKAVRGKNLKSFMLPIIFPIIIHHGVQKFAGSFDLKQLIYPSDYLNQYVPQLKVFLIDLMQFSEKELPNDMELDIILSVMQTIFQKNVLDRIEQLYQKYHKKLV